MRTSVRVINRNRKLLVFPVLIAVFTVFIALFFIVPIVFVPTGYGVLDVEHWKALSQKLFGAKFVPGANQSATLTFEPWLWGYATVIYLVSMFAATFFNVAFNSEVIAALNGDPVSLRHGFNLACGKVKSIAVWSLFAGLVGILIQQIEERLSFLGRIIAGFIGLAWSVSSVFVIPVLIREEPTANPIKILGKSAGTIKRTWGEMLTGYIGLQGAHSVVFTLSIALVAVSLVLASVLSNFWILIPIGVVWLLSLFAYSYLANVASQVYLCALYIYASEGVVPEPFDKELLDRAWKVKKS